MNTSLAAVLVAVPDANGNLVLRDHTRDWQAGLSVAALGADPRPGSALYLGFRHKPTGHPLTLAWRLQGPGNDLQERRRLIDEAASHQSRRGGTQLPPAAGLPPHHSVRLVWEYATGDTATPWQPLVPVTGLERPAVGQVMDDTRALTLDGMVELHLPDSVQAVPLSPVTEEYVYVRCRLISGAYDAPPIIGNIIPNGVLAEQAVPVYKTFEIPADVEPDGPEPQPGTTARLNLELDAGGFVSVLTFLTVADANNANDALELLVLDYQKQAGSAGSITLELIQLGNATSEPDQQFTLPQAPALVDDFRLFTHLGKDWQVWQHRPDLDASGRSDAHCVLDATTGQITFGNGERGRVPAVGAHILAAYRATRAEQGNVAAGTPAALSRTFPHASLLGGALPGVSAQIPYPATGGAAAETLAGATGRAVELLSAHERLLDLCDEMACQTLDQIELPRVLDRRAPTRAVNLLDLERLALDVPGTHIARVRAWPDRHPAYPCLHTPGVITLIVLPELPPARPAPSPGLLAAVKSYLERRRMVTTRIEVIGPEYLEVSVTAQISLRARNDASRVQQEVRAALNRFLDPRRGGPNGQGWPFGRDVYRSEILQVIDQVPGVDYVRELRLRGGEGVPQCGNLALCATWLVTPGDHRIEMVQGA